METTLKRDHLVLTSSRTCGVVTNAVQKYRRLALKAMQLLLVHFKISGII